MPTRIVLLVETPGVGRLGRHVEHDPRSRAFAVSPAAKLEPVLWERKGGPFDQGDLGSCTGNAIAGCLNTEPFVGRGPLLNEQDAVNLYGLATHHDRIKGVYPPDDTGSSGLAVCKAAQKTGLIAGYKHAFSVHAALAALQHGPVITGVPWYEGFDSPDATGRVQIAGSVRGGHEFAVVGYDPATDLLTAWNSWGPSWGDGGRFYFTSAVWAALLAQEGDVTVPTPLA